MPKPAKHQTINLTISPDLLFKIEKAVEGNSRSKKIVKCAEKGYEALTNDVERVQITWYVGVLQLKKSRLSIAICGKTGEPCNLAVYNSKGQIGLDTLKTLILLDVYVGQKSCEDATRCLNLDCKMNKTAYVAFEDYGVKSQADLKEMASQIKKIAKDFKLKPQDTSHVLFKKPAIIRKKRGFKTASQKDAARTVTKRSRRET